MAPISIFIFTLTAELERRTGVVRVRRRAPSQQASGEWEMGVASRQAAGWEWIATNEIDGVQLALGRNSQPSQLPVSCVCFASEWLFVCATHSLISVFVFKSQLGCECKCECECECVSRPIGRLRMSRSLVFVSRHTISPSSGK